MRLPLSFKDKSTYSQNQKKQPKPNQKRTSCFSKEQLMSPPIGKQQKKKPNTKKQKIQDG